ncbi:hypothetical protein ACOI8A_23920 [Pseudomonas sp. P4795]|uniref:hypothetical protein n=1 Tax=Pseudomonas sp. P4795 TaxID=3409915 RepID=UPI003B5A96E6
MDTAIFSSVIAAASAIMGGGMVSIVQLRSAREAQSTQLRLESIKINAAVEDKRITTIISSYTDTHKILSRIAREYSLTSLDIMWRAELSEADYDQKYLISCECLDGARAIVDLYFPEISAIMKEIYGQMNVFWGSFKEIRSLTQFNESYAKKEKFHAEAAAASLKLSNCVSIAKSRLNSLVSTS